MTGSNFTWLTDTHTKKYFRFCLQTFLSKKCKHSAWPIELFATHPRLKNLGHFLVYSCALDSSSWLTFLNMQLRGTELHQCISVWVAFCGLDLIKSLKHSEIISFWHLLFLILFKEFPVCHKHHELFKTWQGISSRK